MMTFNLGESSKSKVLAENCILSIFWEGGVNHHTVNIKFLQKVATFQLGGKLSNCELVQAESGNV